MVRVMKSAPNHSVIMQALDWAYEKALSGLPGMDSATELAHNYLKQEGSIYDKVNSLIRWQNAKAGTSGFVTGLGGLITLPVAVPANLASVLFIQMRMIAAIAYMGGHDIRSDKVKTLVFICLVGNFSKDLIQETAILAGTRLTARSIQNISEKSLLAINKRVGFRLMSTYSSKGAVNLGKLVPLVGGIIGGTIDSLATNLIGNVALKTFISSKD